jgi:uncharacterized membrane protein YccC
MAICEESSMTWTVLGALLGALIGAGATFYVQHTKRHDALRRERKDAIEAFQAAAQEVESIAGARHSYNDSAVHNAHRALWTAQKRLELVCSPALLDSLNNLANTLNMTLWDGPPNGMPAWQHFQAPTAQFNAAARREIE